MRARRRRTAGLTLIEVLISVTLLTLLMVGMSMAMRIGLSAFSRTNDKLMDDRRVAGAQRVLQSELEGLMPVMPPCTGGKGTGGSHFIFFQAESQLLRMVSTYSLQQNWRGEPRILEFFIIPGEKGRGVRLVVNETPYTPAAGGSFCQAIITDPELGIAVPAFRPPPEASTSTFVLADNLAFCKFSYFVRSQDPNKPAPIWYPRGTGRGWPLAIHFEMAPLEPDLVRLQPISVMAQIHIQRSPEIEYGDF